MSETVRATVRYQQTVYYQSDIEIELDAFHAWHKRVRPHATADHGRHPHDLPPALVGSFITEEMNTQLEDYATETDNSEPEISDVKIRG